MDKHFRDVHEIFPRVNYLDGISVNAVPFELVGEASMANLPPYKIGFCPDEAIRMLVESFLVEYLTLYDGPDGRNTRQKLLNAYDENATLTFSINTLGDSVRVDRGDESAYSNYLRSSHNIMLIDRWDRNRDKIVKEGGMAVAVALSELPLTTHIKESFMLDFNFIADNVIFFTLQGILRDGEQAFKVHGPSKFFVRNFVVVPKGDGKIAIISDMLTLTPISNERMERYNTLLKKAASSAISEQINACNLPFNGNLPSSSGGIYNSMGNGNMAPPPPPTPQPIFIESKPVISSTTEFPPIAMAISPADTQKAMIEQFSTLTGMKPEWAEKCLLDNEWNYAAAQKIFEEMRANIPAEAFKTG